MQFEAKIKQVVNLFIPNFAQNGNKISGQSKVVSILATLIWFKALYVMEKVNNKCSDFEEQIKNFLDDFMLDMYKGKDHIIARKYFQELFKRLIPKYFCICEEKESDAEAKPN